MVFSIGNIIYISLLLVNAIAVLSEERFLARSACRFYDSCGVLNLTYFMWKLLVLSVHMVLRICCWTLSVMTNTVGWSTQQPQAGPQGFAQPYDGGYGGAGGGQADMSVKMKLVNLIGAVRTLMRSECLPSLHGDVC